MALRGEYNIKINLKLGCGLDFVSQDRIQLRTLVNTVVNFWMLSKAEDVLSR